MELRIANLRPGYGPPTLTKPPQGGYLHLAAAVAPPTGPPFVRRDTGRAALLGRLQQLADEMRQLDGVDQVTVYRATLIPPLHGQVRHPARYDVAVLAETRSPEVLDEVRAAAPYQRMLDAITSVASDVHVMAARCLRSLGDVDKSRQGLFLFNHFVADDAEVATQLWEHLAGWYVAETRLDNSTLLAPLGDADYVLVNHARWDMSVPRFAAEQFGKPTFYSYVRANLRANGVVSMPVLYRLA